jgi:hypothetical protein
MKINPMILFGLGFGLVGLAVAANRSAGGFSGATRLKPDTLSFVNAGETYLLEIPGVPEDVIASVDEHGYIPDDALVVNTAHDMVTEDGATIEGGKLVLPVTFDSATEVARPVMLVWSRGTPYPLGQFNIHVKARGSMGRLRATGRRVGHHHERVKVPGVI